MPCPGMLIFCVVEGGYSRRYGCQGRSTGCVASIAAQIGLLEVVDESLLGNR